MDIKNSKGAELRSSLLYMAFPSLISRDLGPTPKELVGVIRSRLPKNACAAFLTMLFCKKLIDFHK